MPSRRWAGAGQPPTLGLHFQPQGAGRMTFIYDYDRLKRLGMPEAIFCQGKDIASLEHDRSRAEEPRSIIRFC